MFALFYNLILAMFTGTWTNRNLNTIIVDLQRPFSSVFESLGSLFACFSPHLEGISDPYEIPNALANIIEQSGSYAGGLSENFLKITAFILALITSIGIVVMAIKGIKRVFSVFFYGVR